MHNNILNKNNFMQNYKAKMSHYLQSCELKPEQ